MKKYRLGIDVGTASVACAAFALDDECKPAELIHCKVRIFEEPLQPAKSGGAGAPKKAARRLARQMRRQHRRRSMRLRYIVNLWRKHRLGADPLEIPAVRDAQDPHEIHALRARSATERIPLDDLLRVLLHLAKRRGYMGELREQSEKEKAREAKRLERARDKGSDQPSRGQVRRGIEGLREAMRSSECDTLGQYMHWRLKEGKRWSLSERAHKSAPCGSTHLRLKEDGLFADKAMTANEFDRIWDTQAQHHPILGQGILKEEFKNAVFYKRPLLLPASGSCELEPTLPRAPKAHPAAQEFRLLQAVADLMFVIPGERNHKPLTARQRKVVIGMLKEGHEVLFDDMRKRMHEQGCPPSYPDARFNFERNRLMHWRKGDKTASVMKELGLADGEDGWNNLADRDRTIVINLLADAGGPEIFWPADWHLDVRGKSSPLARDGGAHPAVRFINRMAEHEKFDTLAKMGFDQGRAQYSLKALSALNERMHKGASLTEALKAAYPESMPQPGQQRMLQKFLPVRKPTGSAVVDVALRQCRWLINNTIEELWYRGYQMDSAVVELSRDMARGLKARSKVAEAMNKIKGVRDDLIKLAKKCLGRTPSASEMKRLMLWDEQGRLWCPYCSDPINMGDARNPQKTEVDHILPRSVTRISGRRDFLVLAHKSCHADKRGNRTPWQAWGEGRNRERWNAVQAAASKLKEQRKSKRSIKAEQLLHEGSPLESDTLEQFSDRQYAETSWIGKICGAWLREVLPDGKVLVSRGHMTAHLRHSWGLSKIIPELRYKDGMQVLGNDGRELSKEEFGRHPALADKRIDHRHHLIDAIVIGLTSRKLYKHITDEYRRHTERHGEGEVQSMPSDLRVGTAIAGLPDMARKFVADLSNIYHRPDRNPAGAMFEDTAYTMRCDDKGVERYASYKPLDALVAAKGASFEKIKTAAKNRIVAADVRNAVLKELGLRERQGIKASKALDEPVPHPSGTLMRRALCFQQDHNRDGKRVKHKARHPHHLDQKTELHKYLKPSGYAYLEVFQREDGKYAKRLVRLHRASNKRPPEGVLRFYKNDTVCGPATDNKPYVVRQFGIRGGGALMLVLTTETLGFNDLKKGPRKICVSVDALRGLKVIDGTREEREGEDG